MKTFSNLEKKLDFEVKIRSMNKKNKLRVYHVK